MELPFYGNGYAPCFLRHDDGYGVAVLRYAHRGAVAQSEFLRDVETVAYGQYAACGAYALIRYYHGAVVQWRVLKKDVLYESLVDVGVDYVAGLDYLVERGKTLHHDERAHLALAHAHACHDDGHYRLHVDTRLLIARGEQAQYAVDLAVGAEVVEELAYFLLEQYYNGYHSDAYELVHYAA